MATQEERNKEEGDRKQQQKIRSALNTAYSFVLGQQSVRSFATYTFEDALDAQVKRIEGAGTDIRPNELERVKRIKNLVIASAEDVREHNSAFVEKWERANTPVGG